MRLTGLLICAVVALQAANVIAAEAVTDGAAAVATDAAQTATTVVSAATDAVAAGEPARLTDAADGVTINEIHVEFTGNGYGRNPRVIRRGLDISVGAVLHPDELWRRVQRIRNLEIYSSVTVETSEAPSGVSLTISLGDRWSINPIIRPFFGGKQFLLEIGVRDSNLAGTHLNVAGWVGPYISEASKGVVGGAELHDPAFLRNSDLYVRAQRRFWTDPWYTARHPQTTVEADSVATDIELRLTLSDIVQPLLLLGWERRMYSWLGATSAVVPGIDMRRSNDIRSGIGLRVGIVDYLDYRYRGLDGEVRAWHSFRTRGGDDFWGGSFNGRLFLLPHPKINLAFRAHVDIQGTTRRLDDFGYDGLMTMRGYPNRFLRGSKGLYANHEVRFTLAENLFDRFYLASALFYDYGWVGTYRKGWREFGHAAGVGFRAALTRMIGMYLRIDVAQPLRWAKLGPDISVSVAELF